jgi:1,4-alpha-glucan branching enzyme
MAFNQPPLDEQLTELTETNQPIPPRQRKTRRVHVEFIDPVAESVGIAGTFNDWRPEVTPMIHLGGGRWVKDLALLPGVYEYCLVVDRGTWVTDPRASETAPNPFGGLNAVLRVAIPAASKSSQKNGHQVHPSK